MTVEDNFDSLDSSDISNLFYEPEAEPIKSIPETYLSYTLHKPSTHSLWSHVLWNAAKVMTNHLKKLDLENKNILELGSGTGLPIISAYGNNTTIATDYPDKEVLDILQLNADINLPPGHNLKVIGLIWGDMKAISEIISEVGKIDLILMSDLIFNYTQHSALLLTAKELLREGGYILKTFSHHLPQHKDRDLGFFKIASDLGFEYEKLYQETWKEMFPKDSGDLQERQTVYCFKLWIPNH